MNAQLVRLGRLAMATRFEFLLCGEDPARLRAAGEAALRVVEALEAQLSRFLATSEVRRINTEAVHAPVVVEPRLLALLQRAVAVAALTEGAFDVLAAPGRPAPATGLQLDPAARTVRLTQPDLALDLGAMGKGFALDAAAQVLRQHGVARALLHCGHSTIHALGAWTVGIVDPRDAGHRLGTVVLTDQSLSTSSGHGRLVDGQPHVVDPRTGVPLVGRAAAWAVAPSSADSDAFATAFLVLGETGARRVCARVPELGGMILADRQLRRFGAPIHLRRAATPLTRRSLLAQAGAAAAAFAIGLPTATAGVRAPRERTRCAVVGLGEQGQLLLSQLLRQKDVQIAAVCDPLAARREPAVALAGRQTEAYATLAELLAEEKELDAVVIAAPTHAHASLCTAALAAGKHVFCEAPLAHTLEDARAIVRAARDRKLVVHVGHQRRASSMYPHALSHVESGAIGDLLQVRAQWHRKQSWRRVPAAGQDDKVANWRLHRATSRGLLLEQGVHLVDLANWQFGALPTAVTGTAALQHWKDGRDLPDSTQAVFEYPDGRTLHLSLSLTNSYGDEWELLIGTAGAILLLGQGRGLLFREADAVAQGWEAYARTENFGAGKGLVLDANATKYSKHEASEPLAEAGKADWFAEMQRFLRAIQNAQVWTEPLRDAFCATVACLHAADAIDKKTWTPLTAAHFEA